MVRVKLDGAKALESLVETFTFHWNVPWGRVAEIELAVASASADELDAFATQSIAGMPEGRAEALVK